MTETGASAPGSFFHCFVVLAGYQALYASREAPPQLLSGSSIGPKTHVPAMRAFHLTGRGIS